MPLRSGIPYTALSGGNQVITNITLENFKCFREVEFNPRRITVFVGPNGTGKFSVLQALALLKQSAGSTQLNMLGPLVNLRSDDQLIPNFGSPSQRSQLAFSWTYERPIDPIAEELFQKEEGEEIKEVGFSFHAEVVGGALIVRNQGSEMAGNLVSHTLEKLRFVGAARGLVQSVYSLGGQIVDDLAIVGGLSQQEHQTAVNLAYSRQLEEKLSSLLKRVTGVGLRVNPIPSQSVEVLALANFGSVNMAMEGFGTSALILLFLQLASAKDGATILIEEPEIHLHPKAQADLASVLVEEAQAEDKQIIMTTHSEHILGRLLTLVAEKSWPPMSLRYTPSKKMKRASARPAR